MKLLVIPSEVEGISLPVARTRRSRFLDRLGMTILPFGKFDSGQRFQYNGPIDIWSLNSPGEARGMPTYSYRCSACANQFDQFQRFADDPLTDCPTCGGEVKRVIQPVGVVFKGSGWYITDNRPKQDSESSSSSNSNSSSSSKKVSSDSTASKSTESKTTEAKTEKAAASA
jgi:putative FmdB family regulatory protein